jgi:Insertion element 4 transposase N-terminal/Transposase DDE domain
VIDTQSSDGKREVARLTDVIGIGVLTRMVTRELVDDVLLRTGTKEVRNRGLPARVVVYFVLAMALFSRDSYEEVMRKLVQGLRSILIVKKEWKVPTSSAFSKARVRLGIEPMREIFDMVAVPCAMRSTAGAWKRGHRLMAIDGVEIDAPDTPENAERFGYSGVKKKGKSAFVKVPAMVLAECGTHAVVEVEIGTETDSEHSLADRLVTFTDKLEPGMLVLTDRGLYSYNLLSKIVEKGAAACMRVSATLDLPVLKWLSDGSFLSYIAEPSAKNTARSKLRSSEISITDLPGMYVRVVEYEVPNRGDESKRELFTLVTNITDPGELTSVDLAEAYRERWEAELTFDEIETHQRGGAVILRSKLPDLVIQELYGYLVTHYGIRQLMTEAADQAELDPDRISFTRSLNIIRRQVTGQAAFSPSESDRDTRRNDRRNK